MSLWREVQEQAAGKPKKEDEKKSLDDFLEEHRSELERHKSYIDAYTNDIYIVDHQSNLKDEPGKFMTIQDYMDYFKDNYKV